MELKLLEECHVSPPPGSVPNTSLPLTFFDLLFLSRHPVQRLFFYEFPHPVIHFVDVLLPNIKHSLSLTLRHFYPLAGSLKWPHESMKPELVYEQSDSVSLIVAESAHDFCQLSASSTKDAIESTPLIPKFRSTSIEKGASVLALQVTLFPNQGICIGITFSHTASDGRTFHHFMKTWASFCKLQGNDILLSTPFYDRSVLNYLKSKEILLLNQLEKANITKEKFHTYRIDLEDPVDKIWGTFVLGVSEIKRLKQAVSVHIDKLNEVKPTVHISSFVVTCAYVWVCHVKARWGETDHVGEELECLMVPMDARERLDPPLPVSYFGNCVGGVFVVIERSKLIGKDGVAVAAKMIRSEIQNIDLNAEIRDERQVEKAMARLAAFPPEQVIAIASSPKFGVYETDFGWGKPKRVELSSIHNGKAVCIEDCPNEQGALEISLVRKRKEMDAFVNVFASSIDDLS